MKITFPLEGFNVSGGLRIITNIANGLSRKGHSVRIIVPDYAANSHFVLDKAVELAIVPTPRFGFFNKAYYRLYLCLFSTAKSDVVFATGYKTPYYLLISKLIRNSNPKLVYLIQGYEPMSHVQGSANLGFLTKMILNAVATLSYRLPLTKIAVSTWLKSQIYLDSVSVISNGVDLSIFHPVNPVIHAPGVFVIGIIGSRSPGKGYSVFLQAMQLIVKKNIPGIRVLLATQSTVELPVGIDTEEVRPANDSELVQFYTRCDVFVFASFVEGFGLPPLEAMACGIPVITTDCGGVMDFANSDNALIIPVGDSVALSKAILRMRSDMQLINSLRARGEEVSKKFSIGAMIDKYCQLIESI